MSGMSLQFTNRLVQWLNDYLIKHYSAEYNIEVIILDSNILDVVTVSAFTFDINSEYVTVASLSKSDSLDMRPFIVFGLIYIAHICLFIILLDNK